jgi:hypothetical protein
MEPTDVTIEILKGIHSETQKTNERLDMTNERLDGFAHSTIERLDRLEQRQASSEIRLATELIGVAGAVREVRDLLREDRAMRVQVADHEQRITAIEKRTG